MGRFRVIKGSRSASSLFSETVVDTTKPTMSCGKQYINADGAPQFESVCECFDEADAIMICEALNKLTT